MYFSRTADIGCPEVREMKSLKLWCALALMAALLVWPETALNAAREAMAVWYTSVAPALFPFMMLTPMLAAPGAARIWERMLGGLMRRLFALPGAAAPAAAVGMIAGSPAGAHAAARICANANMNTAQLERILCCTGGLSPAFLITGVGAAMLGSPGEGRMLLQAQLAAQITMLLFTRGMQRGQPLPPPEAWEESDSVRSAVTGVLGVCGYMMMFSIAAAVCARLLRSPAAGLVALSLLDVPSAAGAVSVLSIRREAKLILLAALTGSGGLCIAVQNLSAVKKTGVSAGKYLAAKAVQAGLTAGFMAVRLHFSAGKAEKWSPGMDFFALIAAFFALPALISLKKDLFLNKRKFGN